MIICDHDCRILAMNARYGGACHDSAVWRLPGFRRYMENLCSNGEQSWLLGDSGYPLEQWLITPFRTPTEPRKVSFNNKHTKARNVMERTIGVLKNRFRCILGERQLHYKPEKAVKIVNACCALHNIYLHFKVPLEDLEEELTFDEESVNGILVRESIMNSMNL